MSDSTSALLPEAELNDSASSDQQLTDCVDLTLDVRGASDRLAALAEWRTLEDRLCEVPLMCSTDWTEAWLDSYGDLVPHWFVLAREASTRRVVGACLITQGVAQKDGPLPIRTLHLGTAGEPDADSVCVQYNELLVEPRARRSFIAALRSYFESQSGIDQWNLDSVTEDLTDSFDDPQQSLRREVKMSYWFDLTVPRSKGGSVLDEIRSKSRRKVRRSMQLYGGVSVDWSESISQATDIFSEMIDLHQARWRALGKPGCYASERFTRFHENLIARLVLDQRLFFIRVRSAEGTIGCLQFFNDRNRALLYQCGRSQDNQALSPGVVTDCLAMQACLERGFDAYDFLPTESRHKRQLSNASTPLVFARRRRPSFKFTMLDAARSIKHSGLLQKIRWSTTSDAEASLSQDED
ncbi:GNAT family N-acetyltransferase [bacterium]|nr:GNAT family N-acetyltransferase [bacterium]